MSGSTITMPGPILDMLAKGLEQMTPPRPFWTSGSAFRVDEVWMKTDAGDVLIFTRAPDMERT